MGRRFDFALLLLPIIVVLTVAAVFVGCRPSEQLDPHFRPKYEKADLRTVKGDEIEPIVKAFVELGVLDAQPTYLDPKGTLDRGTFLTWLIRAWNIYYRDEPDVWIRLAEVASGSGNHYSDVMPHTPLYPYLEGMVQAGRLVGFQKGEWGYSQTLARQELILLRNSVVLGREAVFADEAVRDDFRVSLRAFLADADSVPEQYLPAVATDLTRGRSIALAFQDVELDNAAQKPKLLPTKQVTHREAILALSELGERNYRNAQVKALGEWKPLSEEEQKALDAADQAARDKASAGHGD